MNQRLSAAFLGAGVAAGLTLGLATPASAHPLGNFSINRYHGLTIHPDRVDDHAVVDEAEIPPMQEKPTVDSNCDAAVTPAESQSFATATCRDMAAALRTTVDGQAVHWTVTSSTFGYHPGAANLQTSRTECHLTATTTVRHQSVIDLTDTYRADRVGWHEITAVGDRIGIRDSTVPTASASDELRHYPADLLASPLNQRNATLTITDGASLNTKAATIAVPGLLGRTLNTLTNRFYDIVGSPTLAPTIGLLGIALALLLGAAHAALPGHGKTVMAAYIAGRRGTIRDAITVGATVTTTHTAGVLVLGLLLTVLVGLVGEIVLGWLSVASGLLIATIGLSLLRTAINRRRRVHHTHSHTTPIPSDVAHQPQAALVGADLAPAQPTSTPDARPANHHHDTTTNQHHERENEHHHAGHSPHGHTHSHHGDNGPMGRRGLVSMGIAGGLVPSPSALIVLLGAIALGRTWYGIVLVIAYGIGMATTLTAAGLTLVVLSRKLDHAATHRLGQWATRLSAATPILTAALVLIVGLGLALRGALPLLGLPL
jgi:nickel/cobalt exporter